MCASGFGRTGGRAGGHCQWLGGKEWSGGSVVGETPCHRIADCVSVSNV